MSADQPQFDSDNRRFRIEESTTLNSGAHTIFIESMAPGTTVPPHFHNRFFETFDLISGTMSVYSCEKPDLEVLDASVQQLDVGKPVTVTPGLYHMYKVGQEDTVLRCTLTPGDADFERLLKILNGLDADGELAKLGNSVVLMAIVMDLSDAHLIGPAKDMLAGVSAEKKDEIAALKKKLLDKYDTEEALKALLVNKY
ncbi:hypothetical protein F5Y19DRAFT_460767 [Xylariaceae sp. FL1651]|nr:hypothetical protein F5Y19DRAFT_460767 [Xylariaceae sp. FL1651]